MNSFTRLPIPQADSPVLSVPDALYEVEKYCRRCKECWPATDEFWRHDPKRPDGFSSTCKACLGEAKRGVVCPLEPDSHSRACSTCKIVKPVNSACFIPMKKRPDGFTLQCRDCKNKAVRARVAAKRSGVEPEPEFVPKPSTKYKQCISCGEKKPQNLVFFHKRHSAHDRLTGQCKVCANAASKIRRTLPGTAVISEHKHAVRRASVRKPKTPVKRRFTETFAEKSCNGCKETKPLTTEFWYKSNSKASHADGFMTRCKICESEAQKEARRKRRLAA